MQVDENIYIIPNFDPSELVSYFSARGIHISLGELEKPTNKSVLRVFSSLLQYIKGMEENWEDDGKYLFVVFKRMDELLRSLGITFFELRDLQFPSYNRNLNFLSTVYNFCIYKDSKDDLIQEIENEKVGQKKALLELKEEIEMKNEKIRQLKSEERKRAEEKRLLEKNINELENEVKGIFKIQREKVNQVEALKKEKEQKKNELNNKKLEILNIEQEIHEMRSEIVDDPNAMISLIDEMETLVVQGKRELDDLQIKLSEKRRKKMELDEQITDLQSKIKNAVSAQEKMNFIQSLKAELKKIEEKNLNFNSEILFEQKRANSLAKQISHIEIKIENIKQKEQESSNELSGKLSELKFQYEDVKKERRIQFERIENNQKEIKDFEFETAQMSNKHQKQVHNLLCALGELKNAIKNVLGPYEDFLNENN